jgi:hypothetical protein
MFNQFVSNWKLVCLKTIGKHYKHWQKWANTVKANIGNTGPHFVSITFKVNLKTFDELIDFVVRFSSCDDVKKEYLFKSWFHKLLFNLFDDPSKSCENIPLPPVPHIAK